MPSAMDELWARESPLIATPNESFTVSHDWSWATTVSSPSDDIYIEDNPSSQAGANLSGSASASGTVQTSRTISSLKGGERYVLILHATVDGNTEERKCMIICAKNEAGQ